MLPLRAFSGAVYSSLKEESIFSLLNGTSEMRNLFIIPMKLEGEEMDLIFLSRKILF